MTRTPQGERQRVIVDGQVADIGRDESVDGPLRDCGDVVAVQVRHGRRLAE